MSKKSLIIILVLFSAVCAGFLIWRVQDTGAKNAKMEAEILKGLTAEEINSVLKSELSNDDSGVIKIAQNTETRRAFLRGMRDYLALAAQARREGLTEDSNFKINFEYKKNLLLADLYRAKLNQEQSKQYAVPEEEIKSVWSKPENEKQFEIDMDTMRAIQTAVARARGDEQAFPKLQGGSLLKARENWARTKILSDKAKTDAEFVQKREVQLRLKIVEAGILSADYLRKHWAKNIKATEQEIAAYLSTHPEYDLKKKREKAEVILQQIRAGEDFSRLAAEYSEDRSTKKNGGLYENINKDYVWAEVENAALALEIGQTADRLIETETGYHIVKLENKQIKKEKDGSETVNYSVRHILLQKSFEEPGSRNPDVPPPFVKAEEIAKAEIEKQKRNEFVEDIIGRNQITLPEDFTVELKKSAAANP